MKAFTAFVSSYSLYGHGITICSVSVFIDRPIIERSKQRVRYDWRDGINEVHFPRDNNARAELLARRWPTGLVDFLALKHCPRALSAES